MLNQTVIDIKQTGSGINITTKEGNTFYIPNGVAVIPTDGIIKMPESSGGNAIKRISKCDGTVIKQTVESNGGNAVRMSESTMEESNRRFLEHATRKFHNNAILPLDFNILSQEQKTELHDEAIFITTHQHICDVCILDRSTCGYVPENPQNCEGHYLHTPIQVDYSKIPY